MFSNGTYATIWQVDEREKYMNVQLSTSRKNQNGEYETDFSGFVRFVGKAKDVVRGLHEKDRVRILSCGVTTQYNKEKKVTYTNYVVFECELPSGSNGKAKAQPKAATETFATVDGDDGELPF